jgi:hypothetical protein
MDITTQPATPLENRKAHSRMEQLFNIAVFSLFFVLWAAFGYALVASQGGLGSVWQTIQGLPPVAQAVVWLLFLPVTLGLWIPESAWPLVVRLPLVLGIGAWNLWLFFPKDLLSR